MYIEDWEINRNYCRSQIALLISIYKFPFNFTSFNTFFTTLAPQLWSMVDSLLQGGKVHLEQFLHLLPSMPTHWECKPSHLWQTSISSCLLCATLQHLSSLNRLSLWHCPFCTVHPLGGWDRRREKQAVKQFPPSESHSDPHTGDWGLTPARRWHKHWQTKDLSSEQVRILEDPKS